jgi:hypothetical protein
MWFSYKPHPSLPLGFHIATNNKTITFTLFQFVCLNLQRTYSGFLTLSVAFVFKSKDTGVMAFCLSPQRPYKAGCCRFSVCGELISSRDVTTVCRILWLSSPETGIVIQKRKGEGGIWACFTKYMPFVFPSPLVYLLLIQLERMRWCCLQCAILPPGNGVANTCYLTYTRCFFCYA